MDNSKDIIENNENDTKKIRRKGLNPPIDYDSSMFTPSDDPHATNILDYLTQGFLYSCEAGDVNPYKAFYGKKMIAYYFSASWVPLCRQILPKLKIVYQKGLELKAGFEVIYISSDTNEEIMERYFKKRHSVWYGVRITDPAAEIMRQFYQVNHIPVIVVVNSRGEIITREGVRDIYELGNNVLLAWNPDPV